jgi:hypothetical protein
MRIRTRDLIITIAIALGSTQIATPQAFSRYVLQAVNLTTTKTTGFTVAVSKSGKKVNWAWGDGTYSNNNNSGIRNYPAGTKTLRLITLDGFNGLTAINFATQLLAGEMPNPSQFPNLITGNFYSNAFTGSLPGFTNNTKLVTLTLSSNTFSGLIPDFSSCILLQDFEADHNGLTSVVAGSFATQKSLSYSDFSVNALTQAAVDQILADFVVSLGIGGRVTNTVHLTGGTNSTPSPAGLANKALLVAASWTVTNN